MNDIHPPEQSSLLLNRELSWLAFNERVLEEAFRPSVPLLERLKFLAISAKNLDEFFMVRVAALLELQRRGVLYPAPDGLTPQEQLTAIFARVRALNDRQDHCLAELCAALKEKGCHLCLSADELAPQEISRLESEFDSGMYAALTPVIVDPVRPVPFLPNLAPAFVAAFYREGEPLVALFVLPPKIRRFFVLTRGKTQLFVPAELALEMFISKFFPGAEISGCGVLRVTRDGDLEIEDDAEDLLSRFESASAQRRRGKPVRLELSEHFPLKVRELLGRASGLPPEVFTARAALVCLPHAMEICERPDFPELRYGTFLGRFPGKLHDFGGDCFAAIRSKDILVHHPYESFDAVLAFLRQAAEDPDVVALKQTLYRTSADSPVVKALIRAAENGKAVTVVVELRARFDEEANVRWARDLERAGAQVVFGFAGLKIHAKLSLAVRKEGSKLRGYVHCGTGNYHPVTARAFSDLSLFTCEEELSRDVADMFNYLAGGAECGAFRRVVASPRDLRPKLECLIRKEIANAEAGAPAAIWAKMNSLADPSVILLLYEASCAGVEVDLIVRGVCCLRPGVPGVSERIRVRSIVGRFLEHARIFCFANGFAMPSPHAKVFISSADWMPRNLDRRVETMIPVVSGPVHEHVLKQVMEVNLRDEAQTWLMTQDGTYVRFPRADKAGAFCAHDFFMAHA